METKEEIKRTKQRRSKGGGGGVMDRGGKGGHSVSFSSPISLELEIIISFNISLKKEMFL